MRPLKRRVLLVDRDRGRVEFARRGLADAYDIGVALTVEETLAAVARAEWDAAVVPYDLAPTGSGLEALQALREASPRTFRVLCLGTASPSLRFDVLRLACPHGVVDTRDEDYMRSVRATLGALFTAPTPDGARGVAWTATHDPWVAHAPASRTFLASLRVAAESNGAVYLYGEHACGRGSAAKALREWRRAWQAGGAPGERGMDGAAFTLRVPALRERIQDLPTLAHRLLAQHASRSGGPACTLSPGVAEELGHREWFGNTDELAEVLSRACQRAGARLTLEVEDLPGGQHPTLRPSQRAKDEGQLDCVLRQLRAARNVTGAARLEGCTRANYIRMLRRLGVVRADVTLETESPTV